MSQQRVSSPFTGGYWGVMGDFRASPCTSQVESAIPANLAAYTESSGRSARGGSMNSDSYSVCSTFGGFRDEEPIRRTRHRSRRLAGTRLGAVLRLHFAGEHAGRLRAPGLLRGVGRLSAPRVSRQRWLRLHKLRVARPKLQHMRTELRLAGAKLRFARV